MSLLLKSELRLRVGTRHCAAEVWRAGLVSRCVARAFVQDESNDLIASALHALDAQGVALPSRASILVEDELLFFATLPADGPMKQALPAARELFSAALGEPELLVDSTLTAPGTHWLASALPADLAEQWRLSLSERDVTLLRVQPAVLQDLQALNSQLSMVRGLLVMLRSEGVSYVEVHDKGICDITWERCDLNDLPALTERVRARGLQQREGTDPLDVQPSVVLAPLTAALQSALRPIAEAAGWRVTQPVLAAQE